MKTKYFIFIAFLIGLFLTGFGIHRLHSFQISTYWEGTLLAIIALITIILGSKTVMLILNVKK